MFKFTSAATSWTILVVYFIVDCVALSPLVIVPGAGGSRLTAKLNKPAIVKQTCDRRDNHVDLWPSPAVALPVAVDCWVDNIRLVFNATSGRTENSPGVDVTAPGFGETEKIEFLVGRVPASKYFNFLVARATDWGYIRGDTIRGAPYDFRRSPHEQEEYFENLKQMIERMFSENNEQKVSVLGHSLGNLYLLYFLQRQPQSWKDKYIQQYFAIGAPFGGSLQAIKALASGYDLNKSILPALKLREAERTWPCMTLMLPRSNVWGPDEPLVVTNDRSYTVNDYETLYNDIGYPEGLKMYNSVKNVLDTLQPPGVEVHCIVGTGTATASAIKYKKNQFPDRKPKDLPEDGDGTVVTRSANLCLKWNTTQPQPVHYNEIARAEHLKIVMSDALADYMRPHLVPETLVVLRSHKSQ